MDFGQYAIIRSVKHEFVKEPKMYWKVGPVTPQAQLAFGAWVAGKNPTWLEIAMREIAYTYDGTNIPGVEIDVEGKPFEERVEILINDLICRMPIEMIEELWAAVGQANPMWGPADKEKEIVERVDWLIEHLSEIPAETLAKLQTAIHNEPEQPEKNE